MNKIFTIAVIIITIFVACGDSGSTKKTKKTKEVKKSVTLSNTPVVQQDVNGAQVYATYCVTCHGADGKLGLGGSKDLTISKMNLEQTIARIKQGKGTMMSYTGVLNNAKIKAVAEFTQSLKK